MIRLFLFKKWNISTRLHLAAFFPIAIMFFSIIFFSYHSRIEEANNELADRGQIVAQSIASNSYAMVFGNMKELHRYVSSLVKSDPSIYRIEILNSDKKIEWYVEAKKRPGTKELVFEEPFVADLISIDTLEDSNENSNPKVTELDDLSHGSSNAKPVGFVRVTMSSYHMLQKQTQRFYILCGMAFLLLLVSLFLSLYVTNKLMRPLISIIDYLKKIKRGEYTIDVPITSEGEIGEIQLILNELSSDLHLSKKDLENKVLTKTRELEASRNEAISSQQAVIRADAEKRKLIQKMTTAVDDERKNISRHIHDELNAFILAVKLHARAIKRTLKNIPPHPEGEQINQQAEIILEIATELYSSLRNIVKGLGPEILEILGLPGAITDMVDQYNASQTNCRITFKSNSNLKNLKNDLAITVFRIVQEAISNIIKHAQAKNASISIDMSSQENMLYIFVKDDGSGFNYDDTTPGVGLIGLRERVVAFNGTLEIKSTISKGTEILIAFPL